MVVQAGRHQIVDLAAPNHSIPMSALRIYTRHVISPHIVAYTNTKTFIIALKNRHSAICTAYFRISILSTAKISPQHAALMSLHRCSVCYVNTLCLKKRVNLETV